MADRSLESYFRESVSWETDRVLAAERARRWASWAAAAGWLVAVAACVALALLMPLKRVEPYVIRVDQTSGVVDVVPAYRGTTDVQETVTRYLLTHYATVCERYIAAMAESDYEECGALNSAARNARWSALWAVGNPDSPLNRYKDGTTIRVQVQSVSFFTRANGLKDLAQVRYLKAQRTGEGAEQLFQWIATVQYGFGPPSEDPQRRSWNPLGFRVLEFNAEPEVPTPAASAANSVAQVRP
jgi:type IV secretion system protein VirB8